MIQAPDAGRSIGLALRAATLGVHREISHAATWYIDADLSAPFSVDVVARAALKIMPAVAARVRGGGSDEPFPQVDRRAPGMGHARALLLTTEPPLEEIAAAVGYGSTPAFVKAFRTFYGVTPAVSS